MAITRMLVLRCSKRSRALEDLVEEAWLLDHHNAMLARDGEDLVEECLHVNNLAVRTWDSLLDAILQGEEVDFEAVDATFGEALPRTVRCFERVLRLTAAIRQRGYEVARADELKAALDGVRAIKEEYSRMWATEGDPFALSGQPREPITEPEPGPVVADTDRPRSIAEMAAELDRISRPVGA
jgi:hypothetical protein